MELEPTTKNFDEKPIGQSTNQLMDEYPPDFDPNQLNEPADKKIEPIQKRIKSKVLKIRKQAFQQLFEEVKEDPSAYDQYSKNAIEHLSDSNNQCQQKSLKILQEYLQKKQQVPSGVELPKLIRTIFEKCLITEKQEILNSSYEILFWTMDTNQESLLFSAINEEILNKNPKISSKTVDFMAVLLNNYGTKKLQNLDSFSKHLGIYGNSGRAPSKVSCLTLYKELYRWIGEAVFDNFSIYHDVKDQLKKFAKGYEKVPMKVKRGLTNAQKKGLASVTENCEDQEEENAGPSDILNSFDSRWVEKVIALQKWKEKKEKLEQFIKKIKNLQLVPTDTSHYIKLIKRLLSENNINLLQCGFKILINLCKGLKRHFSHPCKTLSGLVFGKLRDKKAMIVDDAYSAVKGMSLCISMDDSMEHIRQGLEDKAPSMRIQSIKVLEIFIPRKEEKVENNLRSLVAKIVKMNSDGSAEVREASLSILCKMKDRYGMPFFGDRLRDLPSNKIQTIKNYSTGKSNQNGQQRMDEQQKDNSRNQPEPRRAISVQKENIPLKKSGLAHKTQKLLAPSNTFESEDSYHSETELANRNPKKSKQKGSQSYPDLPQKELANKKTAVSYLQDLSSSSEYVRLTAYNYLSEKHPNNGILSIKQKCSVKEFSPNNLKAIINLISSLTVHNGSQPLPLQVQHIEFLLCHSWGKHKTILSEFLQSCDISQPGIDMIYRANIGIKSLSSNQFSLKMVMNQIHNNLSKMTHPFPEYKVEAADRIVEVLGSIPRIVQENELTNYVDIISNFVNVLKCRIQESDTEIANRFLKATRQTLTKGLIVKSKLKLIIPVVIKRSSEGNPRLQTQEFLKSCLDWNATQLFAFFPVELVRESTCQPLLDFIFKNNEAFVGKADLRAFIIPLLTSISNRICPEKSEKLLDQIIEMLGEETLEKYARDCGLPNIESYLQKWSITIATKQHPTSMISHQIPTHNSIYAQFHNNTIQPSSSSLKLKSKPERIRDEIIEPWPIVTSAPHILKLVEELGEYGEPLSALAVPLNLNREQFRILNSLTTDFLKEYSDLLIKWIFWRLQTERPLIVAQILEFAKRVVIEGDIHECELVILHGAMMNCIQENGRQCLDDICVFCSVLTQNANWKERTFRFWINSFADPAIPTNEILCLMISCFPDLIHKELVTLARIPAVAKCEEFMSYLYSKYDKKLLEVYGFSLGNEKQEQTYKSYHIRPANPDPAETAFYLQIFQKSSSEQALSCLIDYTSKLQQETVLEIHIKIMQRINIPFLRKQLSFLNLYTYYQYLVKSIPQLNFPPYLLTLTKTLISFLLDLDENRSESHRQLMTMINKLILILLEKALPMHISQVLFAMIRDQIRKQDSVKTVSLLAKCLGKVIKSSAFRDTAKENVRYIFGELNDIITLSDLQEGSSLLKAFIGILKEIISHYRITYKNYLESFLNGDFGEIHPTCRLLFLKALERDQESCISQNISANLPTNIISQPRDQQVAVLKSIQKGNRQIGQIMAKKEHSSDENQNQNSAEQ